MAAVAIAAPTAPPMLAVATAATVLPGFETMQAASIGSSRCLASLRAYFSARHRASVSRWAAAANRRFGVNQRAPISPWSRAHSTVRRNVSRGSV